MPCSPPAGTSESRSPSASPIAIASLSRTSRWRGARPPDYRRRHPGPAEVGLVVEVADSSVEDDRAMAMTYGGGIPVYWLVNVRDGQLEVYTEPSGPAPPVGYRRCAVFHPGHDVSVVLDGREVARIAVADLLPQADEG
ncbi:MAG: Uma2 family endonuclease [Isosphaeraceae bacterium]